MGTFSITIRVLAILTGIVGCVMAFFMGFEWIYNGYGLNPWIAFPLGVLCILWPMVLILWEAVTDALELEQYK